MVSLRLQNWEIMKAKAQDFYYFFLIASDQMEKLNPAEWYMQHSSHQQCDQSAAMSRSESFMYPEMSLIFIRIPGQ